MPDNREGGYRLLDICCCAGGASEGFHRAGWHVTGTDINQHRNYPFPFFQTDLRDLDPRWIAANFDAAHASPPCQAHTDLQKQNKRFYLDLIPSARELLEASGLPYVIENVEGAPLRDPVTLCGTMFPGLRVIRHRLFETNWPLTAPPHGAHPLVFTHDNRKAHYGKLDQNTSFVQVTGGGNCTVANKRAAMGIDWMTGKELNEALPPAYTEWIGQQLLTVVAEREAA
jgi:DNA (cytosine-5)-methyltransferase 1